MISGRCECGVVAYTAGGDVSDFSHCHCSMCRRLHGAAFVSFAGVGEDQFAWSQGADSVKIYASSARNDRYFCRHCGSQLQVRSSDEPGVIYIALGTVEGSPALPAGYHQFIDSKAPWIDVTDDLPTYPGSIDD